MTPPWTTIPAHGADGPTSMNTPTVPTSMDGVAGVDGMKEGIVDAQFYTYENTDPDAHGRAYEKSAMDAARCARRSQRARTHARIAVVPAFAVTVTAATLGLAATLVALFVWGASSALTLQMGAVMAAAYTVLNDVRISITKRNPDWRRRHRIVALILRRHPLDLD